MPKILVVRRYVILPKVSQVFNPEIEMFQPIGDVLEDLFDLMLPSKTHSWMHPLSSGRTRECGLVWRLWHSILKFEEAWPTSLEA
jgi:hypothetical protein